MIKKIINIEKLGSNIYIDHDVYVIESSTLTGKTNSIVNYCNKFEGPVICISYSMSTIEQYMISFNNNLNFNNKLKKYDTNIDIHNDNIAIPLAKKYETKIH